jgi:hypothetical protein
MFDVFYKGTKPNLFPFELPADTLEEAAGLSRTKFFWFVDGQNDYTEFDFNFHAVPWEEHQIHTWANQWQQDGGTYFANKYTIQDRIHNFHRDTYTHRLPNLDYWDYRDCDPSSVDQRWAPDPLDPPYIYQFPVKWGREQVDGPQYCVPGATEVKYLYDFTAEFNTQIELWTVPEEINANDIDFTWRPDPSHPPYIYHFSSEFQVSSGLTYTVPGATDVKFLDMMPSKTGNAIQVLDIFFVSRSNKMSNKRFEELKERYPHAQSIRFANTMMDTIRRCVTRSKTNKFWVVSSENIYTDFNFEWHPEPWQGHMTHVFGSQHQKWSDTFLINRSEFTRCSEWCAGLEEFPNLNFAKDQPVYVPDDLHDIYYVDHNNDDNGGLKRIQDRFNKVKTTRYVSDYLNTFKRIMATATTEYVWIISSLCDYTRFDFSWQPEPWQREMIHVFPSDNQSRGDTFYIHVESFKKQMVELEILDWFNVINYCEEQRVPRLSIPYVTYEGDNLIDAIKQHEFKHPYTWFVPYLRDIQYNPSIWSEKDKKIVSFSSRNSTVLVPREAKNYINTQAYDYPYIGKTSMILDTPLDIVYISNGEPDAERWYNHLIDCVDSSRRVVHRIDGVNGRTAAYKAAAEISKTPWFFAVFAKIEVNPDFDWDWQPDYLQGPKHYIFHSKNPVNRLEYGHMGVIAYNKQLVLDTHVPGLDFTLSRPHAVIPKLSAVAHYNTTPELTWRTAFRECIKLYDDVNKTGSVESQNRLETWLSEAEGDNAMWSLLGARDAVDFWNTCEGKHEFLMLTFEWKWLSEYYAKIYTPNPKFNGDYIDESNQQPIQLPGQLVLGR